MDALLKAILDTLQADATLIALVPAADITGSYNAESANYPCVVVGVEAGGSLTEATGITRVTAVFDVYADTTKLAAWAIYDRIKALVHDECRALTDTSVLVHIFHEKFVEDSQYDLANDVWRLTARYDVLYSTTSVVAFSIEDGTIYAHASAVSADAAKKVADFSGILALDIAFLSTARTEQERFTKTLWFQKGAAFVEVERVVFKPASFNLLWGVTYNASDTLNDGETAATSYKITQSTTPSFLQFLFQGTLTSTGKKIEIEALNAVVEALQIPFSKAALSEHRCRWQCLGDTSSNVLKVAVEN